MSAQTSARKGFFFALSAYLVWGTLPLFWKLTEHLDPVEVTAHRALWAVPFAAIVLWAMGRTGDIAETFKSPKKLAILFVCALMISCNWAFFIWAISVERTLEAALAYYINPLLTILLGFFFLGDRFSRLQLVAILIAGAAVLMLTIAGGQPPWLSLALAGTFAVYGILRKTVDVGPAQGFFVEVLLIFPIVVGIVVWKLFAGTSVLYNSPQDFALMVLTGPATAVPLILFALGAKLLKLSTTGIMQFIAPSLIFIIGIFIFGEELDQARLYAFVMIWTALALYAWSILSTERQKKSHPL